MCCSGCGDAARCQPFGVCAAPPCFWHKARNQGRQRKLPFPRPASQELVLWERAACVCFCICLVCIVFAQCGVAVRARALALHASVICAFLQVKDRGPLYMARCCHKTILRESAPLICATRWGVSTVLPLASIQAARCNPRICKWPSQADVLVDRDLGFL